MPIQPAEKPPIIGPNMLPRNNTLAAVAKGGTFQSFGRKVKDKGVNGGNQPTNGHPDEKASNQQTPDRIY
ncbi:MAG: hypothetical protein WA118_07690 [Carboxydocellales bacterium]